MPEYLLEIRDLLFSYDKQIQVLNAVSLTINKGEFVGIIGPNGAGKSTLLKLIGGLLENQGGQIILNQLEIQHYPRKRLAKMVGYVPQSVEIPFTFNVQQVIRMGRYPYVKGILHEDPDEMRQVALAMERMDLTKLSQRPFAALSGGEKQRTIIASVLAQQAHILLLDEPTSSLDLKHQQSIYRILKKLSEEEHKTIMVVTHDINLAAQFCKRLILLSQGKILADGRPDQVLQFQLIQKVYGVKVYIDLNPFTDSLYIIPYDTNERSTSAGLD